MEEMKMKGYKEERQQGIKEGYKRNQGGEKKNKERRQSHPPTSVERVGQGVTCIWQLLGLVKKGRWANSHPGCTNRHSFRGL